MLTWCTGEASTPNVHCHDLCVWATAIHQEVGQLGIAPDEVLLVEAGQQLQGQVRVPQAASKALHGAGPSDKLVDVYGQTSASAGPTYMHSSCAAGSPCYLSLVGPLPAHLWESSHYVSLMSQTEVAPDTAAGAPIALLAVISQLLTLSHEESKQGCRQGTP